jgi:hypothetical protein
MKAAYYVSSITILGFICLEFMAFSTPHMFDFVKDTNGKVKTENLLNMFHNGVESLGIFMKCLENCDYYKFSEFSVLPGKSEFNAIHSNHLQHRLF